MLLLRKNACLNNVRTGVFTFINFYFVIFFLAEMFTKQSIFLRFCNDIFW